MEQTVWETWCRESASADCFVEGGHLPANVVEAFGKERLLKHVCRLDCDEKYKKDSISDFEVLLAWTERISLCKGTAEERIWWGFLEILGLEGVDDPAKIWQCGNERLLAENASWNTDCNSKIHWGRFVSKIIVP